MTWVAPKGGDDFGEFRFHGWCCVLKTGGCRAPSAAGVLWGVERSYWLLFTDHAPGFQVGVI